MGCPELLSLFFLRIPGQTRAPGVSCHQACSTKYELRSTTQPLHRINNLLTTLSREIFGYCTYSADHFPHIIMLLLLDLVYINYDFVACCVDVSICWSILVTLFLMFLNLFLSLNITLPFWFHVQFNYVILYKLQLQII